MARAPGVPRDRMCAPAHWPWRLSPPGSAAKYAAVADDRAGNTAVGKHAAHAITPIARAEEQRNPPSLFYTYALAKADEQASRPVS